MRAWQPIETAPTDTDSDKPILVFSEGGQYDVVYECWQEDDQPVWFNGDMAVRYATHWQPLPEPPK